MQTETLSRESRITESAQEIVGSIPYFDDNRPMFTICQDFYTLGVEVCFTMCGDFTWKDSVRLESLVCPMFCYSKYHQTRVVIIFPQSSFKDLKSIPLV